MAAALAGACSLTLVAHGNCNFGQRLEKGHSNRSFAKDLGFARVTYKQNISASPSLWKAQRCQASVNDDISSIPVAQHTQDFLSDTEKVGFLQRFVQAWHILFPAKGRSTSNAEIAKQRLKMILIADRCSVNDEAKRKIVTNIVGALSHFVEIESEEKVQFNVTSDPDLGTVYAVTVPVRRVKPEYQEFNKELKNQQFLESLGEGNTVDIRFE
ncbi:hypothetical protein O6H91_08G010600 [Diphasiastrum complanatum]|uniref:Uncharacterized protein n=1 Tax=Diphasiastrum complanatum TaxID=34168 RepID=A0ACC2CUW0_DIPCM|nr:hypothetical protein O6H91_08G010600 [Diphasiastrum complanatum]